MIKCEAIKYTDNEMCLKEAKGFYLKVGSEKIFLCGIHTRRYKGRKFKVVKL